MATVTIPETTIEFPDAHVRLVAGRLIPYLGVVRDLVPGQNPTRELLEVVLDALDDAGIAP